MSTITNIILVVDLLVSWRFLGDALYHPLQIKDCGCLFGVQENGRLFSPYHKKNIHAEVFWNKKELKEPVPVPRYLPGTYDMVQYFKIPSYRLQQAYYR